MDAAEILTSAIRDMRDNNFRHKRRGFRLRDATPEFLTVHLLEEAVELQAEVIVSKDRAKIVDEAGDVLCVFLHLLIASDISLYEVTDHALRKLKEALVPESASAHTNPGFTRSSRPEGDSNGRYDEHASG